MGPTLVLAALVTGCVFAAYGGHHDAFQDWQGWAVAAILTGVYYMIVDRWVTGGRYLRALWKGTRLAVCGVMTAAVLVAAELHPHDSLTDWQGLAVAALIVAMYLLSMFVVAMSRRASLRRRKLRV